MFRDEATEPTSLDAPQLRDPQATPADRDLNLGLIVLALALAPSLAAVAWVPEFSTQDGPAHLYSARIIADSLGPNSPFRKTFEVTWQPLPNWMGQLATMAAVRALPPGLAGRAITALTLLVVAGSVAWLRWVVAGPRGLWVASLAAALLSMNVTWLLGFTSFLLGAALVPATLGAWWGGRDGFGPARALGIAGLLVLGYFCHPIGLALSVAGLGILAVATPGPDRPSRGLWTASSLLPLVPLGLAYRLLTRSGGGLEPVWEHLSGRWSLASWVAQVGWVDPISLAAKSFRPFSATPSAANGLIAPAAWMALALAILAASTWMRGSGRRPWGWLAALLLALGLFGPDTLGLKHGHYLPQRVALLGLMTLVPWLDLDPGRWPGRVAAAILALALVVQSAFVWDYAMECRRRVGPMLRAAPAVVDGSRVGTLLVDIRGRFRSNPLLHADCLLGLSTDAVLWTNYETTHYYFPVKVRAGLDHPPAARFERLAVLDDPVDAAKRAQLWADLLREHGPAIDVVIEWGSDRTLDAILARDYEPIPVDGEVRAWSRSRRKP